MKNRALYLIGLLAFTTAAWADGRIRDTPPDLPHLEPAASVCVGTVDLSAEAVPGGLVWTASFTNTRTEPCRLFALDMPEASLNLDGSVDSSGLPGVLTPVPFGPDVEVTQIQEGADECALVDLLDEDDVVTGNYLHCEDIEVAGESTRIISVWTAALREPPYRYCVTGTAKPGTDELVGTKPYPFGDCVDVYGISEAPEGLVVAGPIVSVDADGVATARWIGGNYTAATIARKDIQLTMPAGYTGRPTTRAKWSCGSTNGAGVATCVARNLAKGPFGAIEFRLTPLE